jgi:YVTN family beta-propeller protein
MTLMEVPPQPARELAEGDALIKEARQRQRKLRLWVGSIVIIAMVVSGVTYAVASGPSSRAQHPGVSSPTSTAPAGQSGALVAYVLNSDSGTVTPINTATNTAGRPIKVGKREAEYIGVAPDGSTVYVGRSGVTAIATVVPINVGTNTAGSPVRVLVTRLVGWGCATTDATTPNGKTDYMVVPSEGVVLPISVGTGAVGKPIRVTPGLSAIVIASKASASPPRS